LNSHIHIELMYTFRLKRIPQGCILGNFCEKSFQLPAMKLSILIRIVGTDQIVRGLKAQHDRRKSFRRMFPTVINNNISSGKNTFHNLKNDGE